MTDKDTTIKAIDSLVEGLERIGENDMGHLLPKQAARFHRLVGDLRILANELKGTPALTFEAFMASRRYYDNLHVPLGDTHDDWLTRPNPGYVYCGNLYIEKITEDWPADARAKGQWQLLLTNESYISNNLAELERRLYEYAISAGYDDWTPDQDPIAERIARTFSELLLDEIGPADLTTVNKRNRMNPDYDETDSCASHDFCDANVLMVEAFQAHGVPADHTEEHLELWNVAWETAIAHEFWFGFRTEFPDFDATTMPDIPEGWADTSWHNDTCPSFRTFTGFQVFVDYSDPTQRELPDRPRFTVHADPEVVDGNEVLFETNDWQQVLEYVNEPANFGVLRPHFEALANAAHVQDEDDYGSKRQIDAENKFFRAVECLGIDVTVYETSKMTSDERIDDALAKVREKFANVTIH